MLHLKIIARMKRQKRKNILRTYAFNFHYDIKDDWNFTYLWIVVNNLYVFLETLTLPYHMVSNFPAQ